MAIVIESSASFYDAGVTGATVTKPTGTASGDVLVAVVFVNDDPTITSVDSEFTDQGQINNATQADRSISIWTRVAGGSEPTEYDWLSDSALRNWGALVLRLSGVDTTTPIDATTITAQGVNWADTETIGSITPTVTGCLNISALALTGNVLTAFTAPSGMTLHSEFVTEAGIRGAIATEALSTTDATGTHDWNTTGESGSEDWVGLNALIRPAAAGGGLGIPIAAYHYNHNLG